MKILITGSNGFVGKNLKVRLNEIKDGKDITRKNINIEEIFEYNRNTENVLLEEYCKNADFIFHLAGVNRPIKKEEFMQGNVDFTKTLLNTLKNYHNTSPVLLASSIQASLEGRYKNSEYGLSKLKGEKLLFDYAKETNCKVLVYRFPNLFGKWCRPNYNSVIATWCNNIAHDLPIEVDDENRILELVYIDDLVEELLNVLENKEHIKDNYGYVPISYKVTLKEIRDLLCNYRDQPNTLNIPELGNNTFSKRLYSTYLSYLPYEKASFALNMNIDDRGSFTEVFKTLNHGQFSINISKPGVTKGNHYHHTKWEFFCVVSGKARIEQRNIYNNEVYSFEVSSDRLECVHMIPGYTHSITNLSDNEDLVTLMWANEVFNKDFPDTYYLEV